MIELKCKNCGGKLLVADGDVLAANDVAIVRRGSLLRCEHCDTEYSPGDELHLAVNVQVQQKIGVVESGGTVVGVKFGG